MKSCLQIVVYSRKFLGSRTIHCGLWSQSATQIFLCLPARARGGTPEGGRAPRDLSAFADHAHCKSSGPSAPGIIPHILKFFQCHADDLVHVVVSVGRQATDEGDARAPAVFWKIRVRLQ